MKRSTLKMMFEHGRRQGLKDAMVIIENMVEGGNESRVLFKGDCDSDWGPWVEMVGKMADELGQQYCGFLVVSKSESGDILNREDYDSLWEAIEQTTEYHCVTKYDRITFYVENCNLNVKVAGFRGKDTFITIYGLTDEKSKALTRKLCSLGYIEDDGPDEEREAFYVAASDFDELKEHGISNFFEPIGDKVLSAIG